MQVGELAHFQIHWTLLRDKPLAFCQHRGRGPPPVLLQARNRLWEEPVDANRRCRSRLAAITTEEKMGGLASTLAAAETGLEGRWPGKWFGDGGFGAGFWFLDGFGGVELVEFGMELGGEDLPCPFSRSKSLAQVQERH
ncbi:hypothetical protein U1Q18_020341 [Sarracenia purpurea var. burkii]